MKQLDALISNVSPDTVQDFFRSKISSFRPINEAFDHLLTDTESERFSELQKLGEAELPQADELMVFGCKMNGRITERSAKKMQYTVAKKVLKEDFKDAAIGIFYDEAGSFRFSLVRRKYGEEDTDYTTWKRYTYFVEPQAFNKTFKKRVGGCLFNDLDEIQESFSVEKLSKQFYKELSNWYFASLDQVEFPNDRNEHEYTLRANSMIRLVTRLMFAWFMKQKGLIPAELFDKNEMDNLLNYKDKTGSTYYKAILQNLFFATLNTPVNNGRKWVKGQYGSQQYYRYKRFVENEDRFLELMRDIPFLNGGLFENLDIVQTADKEKGLDAVEIRVDCFSENSKNEMRLKVPDFLFFGTRQADITKFLPDDKNNNVEVKGIIDLLSQYEFTIDENTPDDMEVALDPELLGTVFENLLASYNPETQNTARKESGSFYTPRPVVDYMVKESLAYYIGEAAEMDADTAANLFEEEEEALSLSEPQKEKVVQVLSEVKILDPACGSGAFPMGCLQQMVKLLNRLDPDNRHWKATQINKLKEELNKTIEQSDYEELENNVKSIFDNQLNDPDYARKLFLIQNCLYGADIQPIAMQITKLRFFISLLVDQENDPQKENYGILALPNLETKFIAANSLIQLDKPYNQKHGTGYMVNYNVEAKQKELEGIREKYFKARTQPTKRKYRAQDKQLRDDIADLLVVDGWDNKAARKIADWDPFDPNAKSKWFDPEWMFGTRNFDIVIGNPPYIQLQKALPGKDIKYADVYKDQSYATFERTGDIYSLFYEMGLEITSPQGVLSYITSNKWMRAKYGKSLRKYFASKKPLKLIDLGPGIFDSATVDTNILFIQNQKPRRHNLKAVTLESKAQMEQPKLLEFGAVTNPGDNSWIILNPQEQAIKEKIERNGKPLKDWDIKINYGIKTGYNQAFIVSAGIKEELIKQDPKSAELLKPILRGRDIKRYKAEFADLWLIFIPWHFPLHKDTTITGASKRAEDEFQKQYPVIYRHLLKHKDKLSQRNKAETGKRYEWYALQRCAATYFDEFEKEKIIYQEMVQKSEFLFDNEGAFCNDTGRIITGDSIKYLIAVFNSKAFFYFVKRFYGGGALGLSGVRMKHTFFENCPLIEVNDNIQYAINKLVEAIQDKKQYNYNAQKEEHQIDLMVYKLYNLTYEEARLIDPELSKEDFEQHELELQQ